MSLLSILRTFITFWLIWDLSNYQAVLFFFFFALLSDTTPLPFYHLYEDGKDFSQFDYFVMMRVSLCQSHFYTVVLSTFLS